MNWELAIENAILEAFEYGFEQAEFEMWGGGILAVNIPLSNDRFALITADFGIGVYDREQWEETGEPIDTWEYSEEAELSLSIHRIQTKKAFKWLRDEFLEGKNY
jgi:hypothetical protein